MQLPDVAPMGPPELLDSSIAQDSQIAQDARFGAYLLGRTLGRGSMGEVFEAVSVHDGQRVAIKIPRLAADQSPQLSKRLINEGLLLKQLAHPSIVRCLEVGELADGRVYLVMEWASGESLRAHLSPGGLPLGFLCAMGQQIAEAMAYAHSQHVLHRDLKPDNILLVPDPKLPYGYRVRVLDFGIGKQVDQRWHEGPHTALETGDALLGTPGYMSPEQCLRGAVTERSDVYSLGVLLFEALTGRPLFVDDRERSLLLRHIEEQPPSVHALRPQVPARLARLLRAMLAKRPAERPTMDEVASQLAEVAKDPQRREFSFSARFPPRLRPLLWLGAAAGLCGLLLSGWRLLTPRAPDFILLKQDILEPLVIADEEIRAALEKRRGAGKNERMVSVRIAPVRTTVSSACTVDLIAAQRAQTRLFESQIRPLLRSNPRAQVVYGGMAPISLALHLGFLVGEMTRPLVFPRPPRADWRMSDWDAKGRPLQLQTKGLPVLRSTAPGDVVVRISASALIESMETHPLVPAPLASIDIIVENPDPMALTSPQELEEVTTAFRSVLGVLKERLPNMGRIHLFAATPPGLTFRLGTAISPTMNPPIQTYEYLRSGDVHYCPGVTLSVAVESAHRAQAQVKEASR